MLQQQFHQNNTHIIELRVTIKSQHLVKLSARLWSCANKYRNPRLQWLTDIIDPQAAVVDTTDVIQPIGTAGRLAVFKVVVKQLKVAAVDYYYFKKNSWIFVSLQSLGSQSQLTTRRYRLMFLLSKGDYFISSVALY